jgi:hypothetical protein
MVLEAKEAMMYATREQPSPPKRMAGGNDTFYQKERGLPIFKSWRRDEF